MKLLPFQRVLCTCTPYPHAPCHFMQSHTRKMHAYLAVTCHLHFWQTDRGLLRATAVTRWWNGYQNKSRHGKLTLEKKILPPVCIPPPPFFLLHPFVCWVCSSFCSFSPTLGAPRTQKLRSLVVRMQGREVCQQSPSCFVHT